ncbi:MAG TPA: SDR family oxidoreductase [Tetrasphaera sp.]|nr:SDR family oxidoreductase [Tetrasphaera sp.]
MTTALITGATAGIGLEFATQLAARGHDLVLVARNRERLESGAQRLRTAYGVAVEVLPADLADRRQLATVAERVADPEREVAILVNNAGFGLKGRFLDNDIAAEEELFDVLCRAVLVLSQAAARAMTARGRGQIINVSSVASFIAAGTYSAAKSYVTVLTESLSAELSGTGVTATALCPGFVHTEFHERAGMRMGQLPAIAWVPVQKLVREALADADKGAVISVPGWQYKAVTSLLHIAPRAVARRASLVNRRRDAL